jgi:hypothetical protein
MWDYYLKEKKHRKEKTLKHQGLNAREGNGKTKNCSSSPFYSIKPVCLGSYNLIETAEKFSPY